MYVCSDKQADEAESCSFGSHSDHEVTFLLKAHNHSGSHMSVLLELLVDEEGSEPFDSNVEFVCVHMSTQSLEEVVRPASVHLAMLISISFNILKSLHQSLCV